jgi:hypothetical protein
MVAVQGRHDAGHAHGPNAVNSRASAGWGARLLAVIDSNLDMPCFLAAAVGVSL